MGRPPRLWLVVVPLALSLSPAANAQEDPADADEPAAPAPPAKDARSPVGARDEDKVGETDDDGDGDGEGDEDDLRAREPATEARQPAAWVPDPRAAPEPRLDPQAGAGFSSDPADGAFEPESFEPSEHTPGGGVPPASASIVCPSDTGEQRGVGDDGRAEIWCADARGRRHGPWVRLHPGGQPAVRGRYVAGRRDGEFHAWFPSGRIEARSRYRRGLEEGAQHLWFESGRQRAETPFVDGYEEGVQRVWHPNGQLASEGTFAHGEPVGVWRWFDERGNVTRVHDYSPAPTADAAAAGSGPPIRGLAAAAGSIGAATGVLVAVPATLAALRLRLFFPIDQEGWLTAMIVPLGITALGAVIGTVFVTDFPGALVAGVGSALAVPGGGLVGAAIGGAAGGLLALVAAATGSSELAAVLFLAGVGVGGATGMLLGPAAAGGFSGWLFATAAQAPPKDAEARAE